MFLQRLLTPVNGLFAWLSGIVVTVMMVHVCTDVFSKYVLNAPVPGTITIVTEYYMPLLTFLPLAFVQARRGHISVEVFTTNLPRRVQHHLYFWTVLLCATVFALLAHVTFGEALKKMALGTFQIEQDVKVLTWPGQFFPSIGYGLVALFMVAQFVGYLAGQAQMDDPIQTLDDDHAEDFGDGA